LFNEDVRVILIYFRKVGHQEVTSGCTFTGNFSRYCCNKLARQRVVVALGDRIGPLFWWYIWRNSSAHLCVYWSNNIDCYI